VPGEFARGRAADYDAFLERARLLQTNARPYRESGFGHGNRINPSKPKDLSNGALWHLLAHLTGADRPVGSAAPAKARIAADGSVNSV